MNNLIEDLKSVDPAIRDKASLDFMEYISSIKSALINQIRNANNINHTGTMIHALGSINCEDLIAPLFEILIDSGFEATNGAYVILKHQDFEISENDNLNIENTLVRYLSTRRDSAFDFESERLEMIQDVLAKHFSNDAFGKRLKNFLDQGK
jgi:hypothetical protein